MKEVLSTPPRFSKTENTNDYPEGIPHYKTLIFVFFMYLLIGSDFFVESVLSNASKNLANGKNATNAGIIVQATLLILLMILVSWLVHTEII